MTLINVGVRRLFIKFRLHELLTAMIIESNKNGKKNTMTKVCGFYFHMIMGDSLSILLKI